MKDFNNNGNNKNNKIDSHSKYTYEEVELFKKNFNRAKSYLAEQKKTLGYTYDTYILKLFFDYWFAKGYLKIDVVEYVKGFEKKGFSLLLEANIGFCSWITNRSNARQAIANCLYRNGIDTSAPNVYEINGGPFDTIMPDTTNMITRFGNMFDTFDSHIEKHDGKVYKISETPESKSVSYTEEILEKSTFILRTSFSSLLDLDADDLDIISELAGTDNTLVTITDVDTERYIEFFDNPVIFGGSGSVGNFNSGPNIEDMPDPYKTPFKATEELTESLMHLDRNYYEEEQLDNITIGIINCLYMVKGYEYSPLIDETVELCESDVEEEYSKKGLR